MTQTYQIISTMNGIKAISNHYDDRTEWVIGESYSKDPSTNTKTYAQLDSSDYLQCLDEPHSHRKYLCVHSKYTYTQYLV